MMLEGIEAVVFDLDGSLVDSMWMWKEIDREFLSRFDLALPEDLQQLIAGMSFSETAAYFKERFMLPISVCEIKSEWNRMALDKYTNEVPLKKGIPAFLEYCKNAGILLGIATSNSRELVEAIADVYHLRNYFSCILTSCDVGKGKPAPDIYLKAAEILKVDPARCLVFEDIIAGIQSGIAAGMKVCAVQDDFSSSQENEKKSLADYYIVDYDEIFSEGDKD